MDLTSGTFFEVNVPSSYSEWKKEYAKLIDKFSSGLLACSEANVRGAYQKWGQVAKCRNDPETQNDSIRKLTAIGLLSYFQRDYDAVRPFFSYLQKLSKTQNIVLLRITLKIMERVTNESVKGSLLFTKPLYMAKTWLTHHREEHGLYILLHGRFIAPVQTCHVVISCLKKFYSISISGDQKQRKVVSKLIRFVLERIDSTPAREIAVQLYGQCLADFPDSLWMLNTLGRTHSELFSVESLRDMNRQFSKLQSHEEHVVFGDLVLRIVEKKGNIFDINRGFVMKMFINNQAFIFMRRAVRCFGNRFDKEPVIRCLEKQIPEFECDDESPLCPFSVLNDLLDTFPDLNIDCSKGKMCSHFIHCLEKRKDLINEKRAHWYTNVSDFTGMTTRELLHLLKLRRILANDYICDPKILCISEYDLLHTKEIRKELIKNAVLSKNKAFERLILHFALWDDDKEIRVFAVESINPTIELAHNELIFHLLNDKCAKVKRCAIKLFSRLNEFNPFMVSTRMVEMLRSTIDDLGRGNATIAKTSAALPPICKYFAKEIECYILTLATAILSLIGPEDSSRSDVQVAATITSSEKSSMTGSTSSYGNWFRGSSYSMSTASPADIPQSIENSTSPKTDALISGFIGDSQQISAIQKSREIMLLGNLDTSKNTHNDHEPTKNRLREVLSEERTEKRNANLCKAISYLGMTIEPVLTPILNMFNELLGTIKNEKILLSLVKSLNRLALKTYNGLNIRLRCPQIITSLSNIMIKSRNEELAVAATKLLGTAFDTIDANLVLVNTTLPNTVLANTADYLLKNMFECYPTMCQPHFVAMTMMVESDPQHSAKYIHKIVPVFMKAIDKNHGLRDRVFGYLEVIASKCKFEIEPLLPRMLPDLCKLLDEKCCVKFLACLSFYLKNSFTWMATQIYMRAISKMTTHCSDDYFEELIRLISYMTMYQNQPFDAFLAEVEKSQWNNRRLTIIGENLSMLIQNTNGWLMYNQARLFQFTSSHFDEQLLFNLVLYFDLPCVQIKRRFCVVDDDILDGTNKPRFFKPVLRRSFYDALCKFQGSGKPEELPFLKIHKPNYEVRRLTRDVSVTNGPYFTKLRFPAEVNCTKWLDNLGDMIVKMSPSSPVRACIAIMDYDERFTNLVGCVAFLACWQNTTQEDRDHFSAIFQRMLEEYNVIDDLVFEIIQICDRADLPMNIDYKRVAEKTTSHPLALYCLSKYIRKNPNDVASIDAMMTIFDKLGMTSSVRGIFVNNRHLLDPMKVAKWHGAMGNWDEALRIYTEQNADMKTIVECHVNRYDYDTIYSMKDKYLALSHPEQDALNDSFFMAFCKFGEKDLIRNIMKTFEGQWTFYRYLLAVYGHMYLGEFDEAGEIVAQAFHFLSADKLGFMSGDQGEITKALNYAQLLIDCQEMLTARNIDSSQPWVQRVKGFVRDEMTWRQMINLKEIMMPIPDNMRFYKNIIKALRKEHQFALLDKYFTPELRRAADPWDYLTFLKILWDEGKKNTVCELSYGLATLMGSRSIETTATLGPLRFISEMIRKETMQQDAREFLMKQVDASSMDEILVKMERMSGSQQKEVVMTLDEQYHDYCQRELDEQCDVLWSIVPYRLKFYRLTADLCYRNSTTLDDVIKCRETLGYVIDETISDYKIWRLWGYINLKIYTLLQSGTIPENQKDSACDEFVNIMKPKKQSRKMSFAADRLFNDGDVFKYASNSRLEAGDNSELEGYVVDAMRAFLKAAHLRTNDCLEVLCQFLAIGITLKDASCLTIEMYESLHTLPRSMLVSVIPQMVAQIAHVDTNIRASSRWLMIHISKEYFQQVFFPIFLYSQVADKEKSSAAKELLVKLHEVDPDKYNDAILFSDGMIRSAITWFESWLHTIEMSARLYRENDREAARHLIVKLLEEYDNPRCELDRLFISMYGDFITDMRLYVDSNSERLWQKLNSLGMHLKQRVDKLGVVVLTKVSEELASKRGMSISVPGSPDGSFIQSIEPTMEILSTQQKPRVVSMRTNRGNKVKYLLKGHEDLRLDERFMQFFTLVNVFFAKNKYTKANSMFINRYTIIPLTVQAGLIQWVTGSDTLHQIICGNREQHNRQVTADQTIAKEHASCDYVHLNALQKLELFNIVNEELTADEVFQWMWIHSPNAKTWMPRQIRYTLTLSMMSIVGYIIGLGDRHPGNIMIQRETGNVIHIDFGESFESALRRPNFPERVPFRLTRMLVRNLLGGNSDGFFSQVACATMEVLRSNVTSLVSQLAIFLYDPLSTETTNDTVKLDRVASKIKGKKFSNGKENVDIPEQVASLIKEAENPANYVKHYPGWCPFW